MQSVLGVGPELLADMDPEYVSQGVSSVEASGGCAVHGPCVKAKCPVPFCSIALMIQGCHAVTPDFSLLGLGLCLCSSVRILACMVYALFKRSSGLSLKPSEKLGESTESGL